MSLECGDDVGDGPGQIAPGVDDAFDCTVDRVAAEVELVEDEVVGRLGLLSAGSDLAYLNLVNYWRFDWGHATTVNMIAGGRAVEAIDSIRFYPQAAGYLLLALSLWCLWVLARSERRIPRWVAWVALLEAVALPFTVLTSIVGPQVVYSVLALLTGVLLGPLLAIGLGRSLNRHVGAHSDGSGADVHLTERRH